MSGHRTPLVGLVTILMSATVCAEVTVRTEQLNPASPSWRFKTVPGASKSDIAQSASVALVGNRWENAGSDASSLFNGRLPSDSLDLTEEALLANDNADGGRLVVDLGSVQPLAAVGSYSWHEWDVDQGSRAPQVYTLYGSAADKVDPANPASWTRIASVDTRPNKTGENWNGQHGVFITDNSGKLGDFRYLLFDLQRTRSPLQTDPNLTGTLFSEIDVHTAATLARAGDALLLQPPKVTDVWVVFKTHLDIGYTDTIEQVLKKYRVSMMEGALEIIGASRSLPPEQRFSWTLAGWPLQHVLGPEQEPARKARIERALREGAIAFHALPFTTHTETQDLEDLVRGFGYSSRLARQYDRPLPIGAKMTDVPCHSWVMPTLLAHAGVKFLHLGCNGTSAYVRVPRLFWWEGPDGSRILCNYSPDYGSALRPPHGWPSRHYLAMEMTGDNHGPPTPAEVENVRRQATKILPGVQVHFGTLDDFARAVLSENPELPVVRGDMPDTWIHGWMSMPLEAKAARQFRALEPALDVLDTQLRAWGLSTSPLAVALAEAYAQSGLLSEHTFGPWGPKGGPWESGIADRYLYGQQWQAARARGAYKKYEAAFDDKRAFAHRADDIVRCELSRRLDLLARSVQSDDRRIVVYNGLPWKRSGVIEIPGQPGRLCFVEDVPANGYTTLRAERFVESGGPSTTNETTIDTPFYKVAFDLKRGGIASLVEKSTGRQLVDQSSPYALGQFLHERFDHQRMLEFHKAYGRPGYSWPKGNLPEDTAYAALTPPVWTSAIQRTEFADIATLSASDTLGLAKDMAIVFTLHRHGPYVDVEWRVAEKTPDPLPEGGWLCFPLAVSSPRFLLGRLGGPIDPAKDILPGANRHYFCLHTGLTITGPDGAGVGLCPLDSPCVSLGDPGLWKFSLDHAPSRPITFVNLYNNEWNTNFPEWQEGSWSSRVRLWPTRGADMAMDLAVRAWEARLPLLAATASGPGGTLPPSQEGLSVSRPGVLVTAFGADPDGNRGTLLRVWDQSGATGPLAVTLPRSMDVSRAMPVNLRGVRIGEPVTIKDHVLEFNLGRYSPASFVLE